MPITITNTLTGEMWVYPDSVADTIGFINLSAPPFSPGLYDVRNSSQSGVAMLQNQAPPVTVPDGDTLLDHLPNTWSISNNENLYSTKQVDGDYIALMAPSVYRGKPWAASAPPLLAAWFVPPQTP
jgi:hypothetical protein